MDEKKIYIFNEKDEKAVQLFVKLGMPQNLAKTLVYISQANECESIEIEHGTYLRQSEVSVATQELQTKGWIIKREQKKDGKGRPVHKYKSAIDIKEVVANLEHQKFEEFEKYKHDLIELKNLFQT